MSVHSFKSARKSTLKNREGLTYTEFRSSLKPDYFIVWFHISLGYLLITATLIICGYLQKTYAHLFWMSIPLCALSTGYWFSFTHLFIHEAAHYNIAADKKMNDLLANIFLGLIAGMHIRFYRIIHFDHHRYLGTPADTENTYFEPLNLKFMIESLTGIRVFKVVAARNKVVKSVKGIDVEIQRQNKKMFLAGAAFNLSLILSFLFTGYWQVALAWMGGIGIVFPFFLSLRQLLEHRDDEANPAYDYTQTEHGENSRMFGTGIIASTLGSAGFNRHLLHHWDPRVPCTRLKDLEQFLKGTELAEDVKRNQTSYFKTFLKLFNS